MGVKYTAEDLKRLKLVEKNGVYVPVSSLVAKKVDKIEPDINSLSNHNAKIKNATKSVNEEGTKFDSNLEKYMYGLLRGAGIDFQFQKEYLLQEKFRYGTEAVRAITLTVDFSLPGKNMIIDTKGMQTQQGAIRWKLLKFQLTGEDYEIDFPIPKIEMPSNKKECETLLNRILYEP